MKRLNVRSKEKGQERRGQERRWTRLSMAPEPGKPSGSKGSTGGIAGTLGQTEARVRRWQGGLAAHRGESGQLSLRAGTG